MIDSLKKEELIELVVAEKGIKIHHAIAAPTIATLEKEVGPRVLIKVVSFLIKSIIDSFKVTNKPTTQDEITVIASDFIDQFKHESLEDFVLCFRKARRGVFNETFHRIDELVLFQWMQRHLEEKAEALEKIHHKRNYPDGKNYNKPNPRLEAIYKDVLSHKLKSSPKIPIMGEDAYNNLLKDNIKDFDFEDLMSLEKDAMQKYDKKVLQIISDERERRSKR